MIRMTSDFYHEQLDNNNNNKKKKKRRKGCWELEVILELPGGDFHCMFDIQPRSTRGKSILKQTKKQMGK